MLPYNEIKALLARHCMNQATLADRLGISRQYISMIINADNPDGTIQTNRRAIEEYLLSLDSEGSEQIQPTRG
jgi:transcriptional regulator with XRE-family HTH domain